ncbi:MAG: hypothetical protein ACJ735_09770 [Actinomycetes bacterium]
MRVNPKAVIGGAAATLLAIGVAGGTHASATTSSHYFGTEAIIEATHSSDLSTGLFVVNVDATGGDGSGGSGTVQVDNTLNGVTYSATLDCVFQSVDGSGNDVLHVTGTIDGGSPATYFNLTLAGVPSGAPGVDTVTAAGINHRSTKPYSCTKASTYNHNLFGGQLVIQP